MYNLDEIKHLILQAIESSDSMREAASKTNLHLSTFRKYATKLGVYHTNQPGKGKPKNRPKIPLQQILEGAHPGYPTYNLAKRLLREGVKSRQCEGCFGTEWMGYPIPIELDHINGNSFDHRLDNLRFLCPNCHAQTLTYRGRKKRS